jgi:hypothetical protein
MKGRGRCGRRNREKVETGEERLGVPQTGSQVGPDAENNGSQEGRGREPCSQIRQVLTASSSATDTLGVCVSKNYPMANVSSSHRWDGLWGLQ